jgi:hypothetical protein
VKPANGTLRLRRCLNNAQWFGWWARQDSNLGPMDYESTALTAELRARALFSMRCATATSGLD